MRRALSFIMSTAILGVGLALLWMMFFTASEIRGLLLAGAGLMIAVGGFWLWDEIKDPVRAASKDEK